jgi:hypothetical protein
MDSAVVAGSARLIRELGAWVYPNPVIRGHDAVLHLRIGLLTALYAVIGIASMTVGIVSISAAGDTASPPLIMTTPGVLAAALLLAAISVFAPQAIFRTGATSSARAILDAPSIPIRPWQSTTIRFNAVLVGAMLAGLYLAPAVAFVLLGTAYLLRTLILNRATIARDPNARYFHLHHAVSMIVVSSVAFVIVRPLAAAVIDNSSIVPLLLAAVVALYLGLAMEALDRWARMDKVGWAVVRDATDGRRFLVAGVSALLAWLVTLTGEQLLGLPSMGGPTPAILAGLGVFIACWLLLWVASIALWRAEAERTLVLWASHQVRIATRLADGSLSPELAAKASLPTTSRMALVVFGGMQALTVHDIGSGAPKKNLAVTHRYERTPRERLEQVVALSALHIPLYPSSEQANTSGVTVWDCLAPGRFATQSQALLQKFSELATWTMVTPMLAGGSERQAAAYDVMFDPGQHWPNMAALVESMRRMSERFDRNPHQASLVVGVYGIDEFPALAGGRYEHAAIGQVMRAALANPAFSGHEFFVAYERPGRIWVALASGPVIRTSIQLLRDLQQSINTVTHGSSTSMDLDVLVTTSFGYAAHQVDDLTAEGLIQTALDRLAVDQATRNPFTVPDFSTLDLRPEQIFDVETTPVTVENLLDGLRADRGTGRFVTEVTPVRRTQDDTVEALLLGVGWAREFKHLDMRVPENLLKAVNRQAHLAALAAQISLDALNAAVQSADAAGLVDAPLILRMPSILVHPEAGDLSLPNILVPLIDLQTSARTVLLFEDVPSGAGQALRMLIDRGLSIAITASAAAGADSSDLIGWRPWGIVFPVQVMQSERGIDGLMINQTSSACAGQATHLIGCVDRPLDHEAAGECDVTRTIDLRETNRSVEAVLRPRVEQPRQRLNLRG